MPLNLLKKYNQLLEIADMDATKRKNSLMGVFNRDITYNENFQFRTKQINPTPANGVITMETLFSHLTTVIVDKETRKREFDIQRSCRLHWIRYHIENDNVLVFSVHEQDGIRTYLYDTTEKYVIILEPLRKKNEYYLITAYHLEGKDSKRDKIMKKYKRRLEETL
jgi:hypothetical protein